MSPKSRMITFKMAERIFGVFPSSLVSTNGAQTAVKPLVFFDAKEDAVYLTSLTAIGAVKLLECSSKTSLTRLSVPFMRSTTVQVTHCMCILIWPTLSMCTPFNRARRRVTSWRMRRGWSVRRRTQTLHIVLILGSSSVALYGDAVEWL